MGMRAGRLRHRLQIQSATKTRTDTGGFTETWTTDATVWGAVEPFRGREYWNNQQMQGEATHRIVLRHRGSVTPANRILFGARVFNVIEALNPDERRISLELMAKEVVA